VVKSNKWLRYEKYKKRIEALNLTPYQYQVIIRIICEILGV